VILNSLRRLSFKKKGFRWECTPLSIGLWRDGELLIALDPAETKRLSDWLLLAMPADKRPESENE
jgi:hypothetical protein